MTALRVVIATAYRQIVGGMEQYVRSLIPRLAERGHQIGFLYERPEHPGEPTIDATGPVSQRWCAGDDVAACLRQVAAWEPDVVYVQGLLSSALEAGLAERFPAVLFAHGYYGTCATGTKRHAFPGIAMCHRTFGPACLPINYARRCGGLNPLTLAGMYRREAARLALLPRFRSVLVASRPMVSEFSRHGVAPEQLHLVPLPTTSVTPDVHPPAARPSSGRVLLLGRLTKLKGGDHAIEALPVAEAALGRRLSLLVAGTGPELERWRSLAARRGVTTEFLGWVEDDQRLELFRSADLLVVPSLWPEPFGLVGIEAGCVGLPAVAYEVGGIPDWLVPGESGELAPGEPPTPAGLADAIVRALADPAHHARLRLGAWGMARRFGMEEHLAVLVPILESACRAPTA